MEMPSNKHLGNKNEQHLPSIKQQSYVVYVDEKTNSELCYYCIICGAGFFFFIYTITTRMMMIL